MPFSQNAEDTFARGINIRNKYQLFHPWSVKKLLEKFFSVNDIELRKCGSQNEASAGICLKRKSLFQKASLYGNMQRIKCIKITRRGGAVVEWYSVGLSVEGTGVQNHLLPFQNLDNFVHPTLLVSFGRDTKSRWSLLPGVYARGSKRSHTG